MTTPTTCTTPPDGFACSRPAGHTGPCAATQDTPAALPVEDFQAFDAWCAAESERCRQRNGLPFVAVTFEQWQSIRATMPQAATSAAGGATGDALREKLIDIIVEHLALTYHCTRVWNAWNVGTMSQDDFEEVNESDTPHELADAILAALAAQSPDSGAGPAYRDSTPMLHVGDSAFESWYDQYLLTAPVHQSGKQRARDAYAAGMGDPLVTLAQQGAQNG